MRTRRQDNSAEWARYRAIGEELQTNVALHYCLSDSDLKRLFDAAPRNGDEALWRREFRTVREISPGRQFARLQEVAICELEALGVQQVDEGAAAAESPSNSPPSSSSSSPTEKRSGQSGGSRKRSHHQALVDDETIAEKEEKEELQNASKCPRTLRVVLKRGKRDWYERAVREAQVHRYLTDLQQSESEADTTTAMHSGRGPRYIAPLLAHYDASLSVPRSSYIVTRLVRLGPLADAMQNRRVHVNSHRLLQWINKAEEVLRWMHNEARVVHTDAKTDNWLLNNKNDVILFDFDECWREEDFYQPQFFEMLKRMDYAKFYFTLYDDLAACDCEHLQSQVRERCRTLFGDPNPNRAYSTLFAQMSDAVDEWKAQVDRQMREKQQSEERERRRRRARRNGDDDDESAMQEDDGANKTQTGVEQQSESSEFQENDSRQVIRLLMRGDKIALI